jgi:hypothetical protein
LVGIKGNVTVWCVRLLWGARGERKAGDIQVLCDDSTLRDRVDGDFRLLEGQVLARDWVALGDCGEDKGLVENHYY